MSRRWFDKREGKEWFAATAGSASLEICGTAHLVRVGKAGPMLCSGDDDSLPHPSSCLGFAVAS